MLNSSKFRKILAVLLACVMMFSLSLTAFAASSEVSFSNDKFSFTPADKDLFANFKNLMPGDKAEQEIKLVNNSDKVTFFSMRMKVAKQDELSPEQLKLVEELLFNKDLMKITITANGKEIYSEAAGGNERKKITEVGEATSALIELGSLSAGGYYTNLNVTLEVSEELDDRYQKAAAYIDWEFVANRYDDDTTAPTEPGDTTEPGGTLPENPPETGSESMLGIVSAASLAFVVILIAVIAKRKSAKEEN